MSDVQSKASELAPRCFLLSSVIGVWQRESARFTMRETGGMLIGYWTRSGMVTITHATGPGPNAIHGYCHFTADHHYCQRILDGVIDQTGGDLTYVGDWHTHPFGSTNPSRIDSKTALSVADDPGYLCPRPLVAIYRPEQHISCVHLSGKFSIWALSDSEEPLVSLDPKTICSIPGYSLPTIWSFSHPPSSRPSP